ncbi:MAG: hypothetical protein D6765_14380 [Bacteroidetes bacterium]|nr:MAG: hypothetical protein D6765_14380 [Bacteroidota bacterium]
MGADSVLLCAQESGGKVSNLFRGTRIVNGQSVETVHEGELEFLISHRFGRLNGGAYELFGLDQASIRIGLEYGVRDWLMVGLGRSSVGKHYDFFGKMRLVQQGDGVPLAVTAFASAALNTLRPSSPDRPIPFQSRWAYTSQLLLARKFGPGFTLQLSPTFIHYNLVETRQDRNDVLALGAGARVQLTKNIALMVEYFHSLPEQLPEDRRPALALGFDINTGSHVFQLHFTNAQSMIEKGFIGETTGDWLAGDIQFGFNIARTFKLKGRRY